MDFSFVSAGSVIFEYDSVVVDLKLNGGNNTFLEMLLGILEVMPVKVWSIVGTQQILAPIIIILINTVISTNFPPQSPLVCFESSCVK